MNKSPVKRGGEDSPIRPRLDGSDHGEIESPQTETRSYGYRMTQRIATIGWLLSRKEMKNKGLLMREAESVLGL